MDQVIKDVKNRHHRYNFQENTVQIMCYTDDIIFTIESESDFSNYASNLNIRWIQHEDLSRTMLCFPQDSIHYSLSRKIYKKQELFTMT